jgi:exonuclease-1
MGIIDLFKIIKPCFVNTHISEFRGKVAAVDMMNWIYRGVYSCSIELNAGLDADLYLNFPLKMLSLLKSFSIEIIAVFDGREINAKEKIDRQRKDEKYKNLQLAHQFSLAGDVDQARNVSRRALKITGKMLNTLIEVLRKLDVRVIIAPYEADSQIAYLSRTNLCDVIISEDSDLIPYGCNRVLYKLGVDGNCSYFDNENLSKADLGKFAFFKQMTKLQRVEFCVLSGCDYLPSIKGLGIKRAMEIFSKKNNLIDSISDMRKSYIYKAGFDEIVYDYLDEAKKSVSMFYRQTVYDPISKELVQVWDDDIAEKYFDETYSLTWSSLKDKEFYYGAKFTNFEKYCNGELDIKLYSSIKETESYESINKYFNKYKRHFVKDDSKYVLEYYKHLADSYFGASDDNNNLNSSNNKNTTFESYVGDGKFISKQKISVAYTSINNYNSNNCSNIVSKDTYTNAKNNNTENAESDNELEDYIKELIVKQNNDDCNNNLYNSNSNINKLANLDEINLKETDEEDDEINEIFRDYYKNINQKEENCVSIEEYNLKCEEKNEYVRRQDYLVDGTNSKNNKSNNVIRSFEDLLQDKAKEISLNQEKLIKSNKKKNNSKFNKNFKELKECIKENTNFNDNQIENLKENKSQNISNNMLRVKRLNTNDNISNMHNELKPDIK